MTFIIKVPGINGLGKTKGCEKAPNEIIKSLNLIYSNEQKKIIDSSLLELEEIHLDNGNLEETNNLIYKNSLKAFEEKNKIFFLGGDHSISYSLVKAFFDHTKKLDEKPCLIVFDAHPDCMEPMKEPTFEEWLRKLIEEGFPAENVLLVGVRNFWRDEIIFLKEKGVRMMDMNSLLEDLNDSCDILMEFSNGKQLYISIDIDVIDPAFAPATGNPEPGGLTSREFIYLISRINKMINLKAIDLVEINPDKDKGELTVKLGAKILAEFL